MEGAASIDERLSSEGSVVQSQEDAAAIRESLPSDSYVAVETYKEYSFCLEWLSAKVLASGYSASEWTHQHQTTAVQFFSDDSIVKLLVYRQAEGSLIASTSVPAECAAVAEILYFLKDPVRRLTPDTLDSSVYFGVVHGSGMESLLRFMQGIFVPAILHNQSWPDSIKKEFSAQLHRFMASLTETAFRARGSTVLYVPSEEIADLEHAAKDKELVQRFEAACIHWTRQIKEVVNEEDTISESSENTGPLAEIEFWRSRADDLNGIRNQLNRSDVKQIVNVLELARSTYLKAFQKLSTLIQQGSTEAQDNLKFLSTLQKPCEDLAQAEPKDIPKMLPQILTRIRMIWSISRFYNTPDRLTGLLRKVSNEVINRCRSKISLSDVFDGDVASSIKSLNESIAAGEAWKGICRKTLSALSGRDAVDQSRRFEFEESSIFAEIDAFVQRCKDLLEVCEGQAQFAQKGSSEERPFPLFRGSRAPEIVKSLHDIKLAFEKLIKGLKGLNYNILDVKVTRWHDDYGAFKNGVKDLEVMLQNVISSAFETMITVEQGVELLEAFSHLAKREAIKRAVEKKTAEVYTLFARELNSVKKEFDSAKKSPPIQPFHPRFAGSAFWARNLINRIERDKSSTELVYYLPQTREAEEANAIYAQLHGALEEYIKKLYSEWVQSIDSNLGTLMDLPLMIRSESEPLLLENNFDKNLRKVFEEVRFWEKLHYDVPYAAMDITTHEEKLRVVREHVFLVVRDYNNIIMALNAEERRLFAERIHYLDRKVAPGLSKLTWASKGVVEYYVRDCRKQCKEVMKTVDVFKESLSQIYHSCRQISETLLVHIEKKKVYAEGEFEVKQKAHRDKAREKLQQTHEYILQRMRKIYDYFRNDSDEIQREWNTFVEKVEKRVDDALRQMVKRSLLEISRAINGDAKSDVQPLFLVNVVLDGSRVEFKPSINQLSAMINSVSKELITVITVVPRLSEALDALMLQDVPADDSKDAAADGEEDEEDAAARAEAAKNKQAAARQPARARNPKHVSIPKPPRPSFFELISNDEEILRVMVSIMTGMSSIQDKIAKYLFKWDKFKNIWELDKDAWIRRFAKANRPLSSFENEITKYRDLIADVQNEDTTTIIDFIRVECAPLKNSLVQHCNLWQNKLFALLNSNAAAELKSLYDFFASNSRKLTEPPRNLDMLSDGIGLVNKLNQDLARTEARFEPLAQHYKLLEKYDVNVKEDEITQLTNLPSEFAKFKTTITESGKTLDRSKENFRAKLILDMDSFARSVTELRDDAQARGPYDSKIPVDKAFDLISDIRGKLMARREKENAMKPGLSLFAMEQPTYKELKDVARDLELLEQIWQVVREWNESWDTWKTGKFESLKVDDMEMSAAQFQKRVGKLGRDIRGWDVWSALRDRIDQFKRTMPLILDLKNPALRPRHFDQLMDEIGKTFDPNSADFTLERVFLLGLDNYADVISNLSNSASKELSIEDSVIKIRATWEELIMDTAPYRRDHYRLRSTDDIYSALEDNMVTLGAMKASRFVQAFMEEVDYWEKTLSLISETVEMLLQVQRQWMYLESIFSGSEDIRKQLPAESALFDNVNNNWKLVMGKIVADPNAKRVAQSPGLLDLLGDMNTKLERIQKQLDEYLEMKRQRFPRFYFLSNDDLLEILGQARDPNAVQPHLKKCFEAIKGLEMVSKENGRGMHALGMKSPEGEYVQFSSPVITEGAVESWLIDVEQMMRQSLRRHLQSTLTAAKTSKREKWVRDHAGQLLITAGQIIWTSECSKSLSETEKGNKNALRLLKKKWISMLNKYSDMVRGQLPKLDRIKLVALITIEVHARDVIDKMIKANCSSDMDFEWLSQLRFFWDKDEDTCVVKQTSAVIKYDYEYLGNSGRLVVTPLTDRCYMTLTNAIQLLRGGNPQGPAGTGKTETVKDLGKGIAKYVIVFNCSDGLDYKSLGRMFSGLAQTGAWSCFDEFNRIEVEVLSVVAQQILSILSAIGENKKTFVFEGIEIKLNPTCGVFVTMNPGYAGRSELPDNLKALLRPISMMVPDSALIAEIMLFSEGFQTAKNLSRKITTLYSLMVQQLSKQDHYDFGLRNVKAVLNSAGALKRAEPEANEEYLLLRACRDMNLPKFIAEDVPLFMAMLGDLFPGVENVEVDYGHLQRAIEEELRLEGLQVNPHLIRKAIQLYETKLTRHGVMVVGQTGSGKSTAWTMLARAMTRCKKAGVAPFQAVRPSILNPKSISMGELYGEYDLQTREWADGILSCLMRQACADEKPDEKWLLLDGPVDTLWIESMNTVLDDNKMLTLISGERISMPNQVSLLFEVQDLAVASPATVSRCGMIYFDFKDLSWRPFVDTWLQRKEEAEKQKGLANAAELIGHLRSLFDKYVVRLLDFRNKECTELVPTSEINAVRSLCNLFDSLATVENGVNPAEPDSYFGISTMWFVFSLIWSIGASVDEDSRKKFDLFLREMDPQFPPKETVFEYFVDGKTRVWKPWEEKVPQSWKPLPDTPFFKILVPTIDTVRNAFVAQALVKNQKAVLFVGNTGTGKTALIQSILGGLDDSFATLTINFSAQTSSKRVQDIIESRVEKKTKDVFAPPAGKRLLTFIDDLNMPMKDTFGSQPPLELLRQWMDYSSWYDRAKQTLKYIKDMQLFAAMGPPGGGRSVISARMQSRFNLINITFPSEQQVKRIFGSLLNFKLQEMAEEIKPLGDIITQATLEIYNSVLATLLPTPSKSHYVFNMRDLSKVFQGLLQANKQFIDSREQMTRLWVHECFRVFSDRLNDDGDKEWFKNNVADKLSSLFAVKWNVLMKSGNPPIFGDFMRTNVESPPYEEITDMLALKRFMDTKLEDYNMEPGARQMDLVLFRDAIEHICRINRVLKQPRGNVLLVGVGGSGRQSLSRLASYVAEYKVFSIEISRQYRSLEFREDLKKLYQMAGVEQKPTVFLFTDNQIVEESFLEDINNILSSGEVPNLFTNEESAAMRDAVRADARKAGYSETPDSLFSYFIERVRNNLHVILCMSPVGDSFRNRIRMFPALVNCTTIDWFSEWPGDALREVAMKFLEDVDLGTDEIKRSVADMFVTVHTSVLQTSKRMLAEVKRYNYVTPTNYLELVVGYRALLSEKRREIGESADKLRNGLYKLEECRNQVQTMSVELEEKKKIVARSQKECEDLLVVIVSEKRSADEQRQQVGAEEVKIIKEKEEANAIASEAQGELDKALPALEAAQRALETLTKNDISEVKAYKAPPKEVQTVLSAVMVVLKKQPNWDEAKRVMGDPGFLRMLMDYDKDSMNDSLISKISKFTVLPECQPEVVGRISRAAYGLCLWVRAMEVYGRVAKEVEPRRNKLKKAMDDLSKKEKRLAEAQEKLREVTEKVMRLKNQYDESQADKERLRKEAEETEIRLNRAEKLVGGLAGERERWGISVKEFEKSIANLVGDSLLAAAFLSYAGPFNSDYRSDLVDNTWMRDIRKLNIPFSPSFTLGNFLARPTDVREWNIQGLPSDAFSTENGVLVARGRRWPLMIDPQGQANKWIKNMERGRGLEVTDLKQPNFLRTLENAIRFGKPVLMQDVMEELDPALEPILSKAVLKVGNRQIIRLGDKEVDYNPDFRFYLTTKLANPHYTPEVSTKTTICNFAVKESGLEDQLLGIVVRKERPDLEEQKNELVLNMAAAKKKMVELEDEILRLLQSARGSLLDDEALIITLQTSKNISEEIKVQLAVAEQTEIKIDAAREQYRPCATRASILYFVLNDLGRVDPMYQFALDAYISLFNMSIDKSPKNDDVTNRLRMLNDFHTDAVYRNTCRGLFEKHKLLFSFQMCVKILQNAKRLNMEEYNFFLRGGQVLDKDAQTPNPCGDWLPESSWDNVYELDHLFSFRGLAGSFEQLNRDWRDLFRSAEPERTPFPGEWETKYERGSSATIDMQRMCIIRSLRPDRVVFMATSFIEKYLGPKFVEPPAFDLNQTFLDSTPVTPLVFVLSPGVDPTAQLSQLAEQRGVPFKTLALGQGQAPIATRMIEEAVQHGGWVFLANCHLMISWMATLEKIVEDLSTRNPSTLHADFRLWLSSVPHPKFPISILQKGIKMTTEPPKGLKANLIRLYNTITEAQFAKCKKQDKYRKLLFALCFYHAILLERRKFSTLGFNIPYDFNMSDFSVSENIISLYLDIYTDTPWESLKYLIAEASYGGRVTDDFDRRILNVYMNQYFCEESLATDQFRLSSLPTYFIPKDGTLQSYKEYCSKLPGLDRPEAFGQHPNADIASQIEDANTLLDTLMALRPRGGGGGGGASSGAGESREERVLGLAADLELRIPEPIDYETTMEAKADDPSALNTVLLQEISRYNHLLKVIKRSLVDLKKGLKGLVVMSAELDEIFSFLFDGKVPPAWLKTYPSLKPLASWTRDLIQRVEQLKLWAEGSAPKIFWLSGFTFPTGFLTALQQTYARKQNVSIDTLGWEFIVMGGEDVAITQAPKDGAYIRGIFMEGGSWNSDAGHLCDPAPMELLCSMPIIHFKPVDAKKKATKGVYSCPLYMYPLRTGSRERPSFMICVDLKTGDSTDPEYWMKRGTALLLSTAQ